MDLPLTLRRRLVLLLVAGCFPLSPPHRFMGFLDFSSVRVILNRVREGEVDGQRVSRGGGQTRDKTPTFFRASAERQLAPA